MVINLLKSWIKENENKINNLFLYSLKNPMKITEMYKDIDANGTGQSYRDLKKFLNSSYSDIDLTSIEIQIDTSESEGIIFFEYKFNENESYFYSLGNKQVESFSKEELFKFLDTPPHSKIFLHNKPVTQMSDMLFQSIQGKFQYSVMLNLVQL